MTPSLLAGLSDALSSLVDEAAPSVVQVNGRRRPASGIIYAADTVLTSARALGREDGLTVRTHDSRSLDASLAGWDPATGLAVLTVPDLNGRPLTPADGPPRVGQVTIALARSWSNAITASAGIIAVIGGPLRTGRRRAVERVIRTTAPMHEGFSGGPLLDAEGRAAGVATAMAIRGFRVAIPAGIAWKTAADVIQHGRARRGFLGVAGQGVRFQQQGPEHATRGVLIVGVTDGSPAKDAGIVIGDVLLQLDGQPVESPEDLLDLLTGDRVGRDVVLRVLRAGGLRDVTVTVRERPQS